MTSIYDCDPNELIEKASLELKKIEGVEAPVWATFVKTGRHKERPPLNPDWFYVRCAAVLRKMYKQGPIGVSKLRTLYGGKKDRGMQPAKFFRGSGSILRKALQQLEKAGFAKQVEKGKHKGRIITPKGKQFLDKIASKIAPKPKPKAPKPAPKAEAKKPAKQEPKKVKVEEKLEPEVPKPRSEASRKKEEPKVEKPKVEKEEVEELAKEVMKKGTTKQPEAQKNG